MDLTRVAVLALAAAVAASFAQTRPAETEAGSNEKALRSQSGAQAQLRTDLIQAARTEKEGNLTPWAPPKAEGVIVRTQNSLPYRLLTGEAYGFSLSFGNMVPGSGFAIGPTYTKPLQDGELVLRIDARAAINQSYGGRLEVSVPRLFSGHAFATFSTQRRNISEMPYYGAGPESDKTGRSNYRLEETILELRPGVRVFKGLSLSVNGRYSKVRDQLNLAAGEASLEELLLRRKELLSGYRYNLSVGLSYSFGSVYSSVVNPRFGSGARYEDMRF